LPVYLPAPASPLQLYPLFSCGSTIYITTFSQNWRGLLSRLLTD
jgi:hypothetical protein